MNRSVQLFLVTVLACSGGPPTPVAVLDGMRIYAAVSPQAPAPELASFYAVFQNTGSEDDALVAVSLPVAGNAEIHETVTTGGQTSMVPVSELAIPSGDVVALEPGSYHVMLTELERRTRAGEEIEATLRFRRAGTITLTVPVVRYTDMVRAIEEAMDGL